MNIRSILFAIAGILLLQSFSFSQTREFKTGSIPYSTQDTFYLNRSGALRVLKMEADFSFCQQAGKLKDSVISGYKILYGISEQKGADLERISAGQVQKITAQRKIILRQRITGVGIITVLVLSVLIS